LEGVQGAAPVIQSPVVLKAQGEQQDVLLTALPPSQDLVLLSLARGESAEEALAPGRIVLTRAMAEKLRLQPGDPVTVDTPAGSHTLTVGGTTDEFMAAAAYVALPEAQSWLGAQAAVFSGLYLRVDPTRYEQVRAALYRLPGAASVLLKSEVESDWRSMMDLFYAIMGAMLAFAVAMAFALLFNAMTVNVLERERELATMRAVGTSRATIALLLTTESAILWLLALVPGLVLGWWVAVQMGAVFQSDLFSFRIVVAPATYAVTAIGILLTMVLAALPAIRRVNRLDLAEATKVLT
jgi:putative ABC transport system permease protein